MLGDLYLISSELQKEAGVYSFSRVDGQIVKRADSNTPVQNTFKVDPCRTLLLDWFEFSLPLDGEYLPEGMDSDFYFNCVCHLLKSINFDVSCLSTTYARNGYSMGWKDDNTGYLVYFNPRRLDMGLHITMSGQVCAQFFQTISPVNLIKTLSNIEDVTFSRVDFSLDITKSKAQVISDEADRKKAFISQSMTPARIFQEMQNGNLKFRWNNAQRVQDFKNGRSSGEVLYFGSMKSDLTLRIYDKFLERLHSKAAADVVGLDSWVRWELTFRHRCADALIGLFLDSNFNFWQVFASILYKMIWIVTPESSTDSNMSRRPMHPDWSFFLAQDYLLEYIVPKTTSTYSSLLSYVCNSIGPSLAGLLCLPDAVNEIGHALTECVRSGRQRKFL